MKTINIAIVSPSQNAYSETFIQAQKKYLSGSIFYYFGGVVPNQLEGGTLKLSLFKRIIFKVKKKLSVTSLSFKEYAIIKSFKKHKVTIVLAQYGTTAHHVVRVCKQLNIPLITHFHGYDASIKSVIKAHDNYKDVFDYSSYVIAVSKKMEQALLALGCSKEKLIYNVYGPQPEFLTVLPKFSKKQLIAIGRFTDKKAAYYTILAFKEVLKKVPDAQLLMAGDGALYDVCVNLVAFYKLEESIKFIGVITPQQFRTYLSESMAFVQHSITPLSGDMEGTPLAVLESSAAGLPVIATNHAGIPDVVFNNETGFLVEEHDVEGMAENMLKVLADKNLAIKLGNNAKERILADFTLKRYLNVLNDLVEKAIIDK